MLLPWVPLFLLIKVCLDVGNQGVYVFVLIRVDHNPRPLVYQKQILVLVDDVELGLKDGEEGVFRGRGIKKLVVDI